MEFIVERGPNKIEIKLRDQLTLDDMREFRTMIDDPQIRQNQTQIFNLENLEHIDSSGMGLLIQANKRSQAQGRRTELCLPPDSPVYRILSLVQFEQFIPYADQT